MGFLTGYQGQMNPAIAAVIAASGTKTAVVNLKGFSLVGILFPATFTGTAVTFEASIDGATFFPVKNTTSGTSLSYTIAQGTYQAIDPKEFYGIQYLKVVSGSTEGSSRTLQLAVKGI